MEIASESGPPREVKVRALIMDGRMREFATGPLHDVTDRVFVVRRAFRVNDSLPSDAKKPGAYRAGKHRQPKRARRNEC